MGIFWIVIDVTLAVLLLQWLGNVIDPSTYGFIVTIVTMLAVLHLVRVIIWE
jgi:hypothetical protein